MKFNKPSFWDYKKPNFIAYLLLPLSHFIKLINFFNNKKKIKPKRIKTICIGNIYIGGTGKTPISIKINEILKNLNFRTAFIKKKYIDQTDEQKILSSHGRLFCKKNRVDALDEAIDENINVAIFDDSLQERNLDYDITFACFNVQSWVGNGLCLPAGPLRENLRNLKKYDGVFLNGNGEETIAIQNIIKNINTDIKIFESQYFPLNIESLDQNQDYLIFSGIGNPNSFLKTLKKNKFNIIKNLIFPDHYNYSDQDIVEIKQKAKSLNAKIITTEKDYNRLSKLNSEGIEYLKIELKIKDEKELINFLHEKL